MADLSSTRVFGKLTVMHEAILKANAEITGGVTASSFAGDGPLLTNLNASNLTSGTVPEARLPASALVGDTTYSAGTGITLSGTTFSLTDESYTSAEKTKLANIEAGAEVNTVDTVNGQTGAVVLDTGDVSENGSLYFTNARARAAISVSGDLSYNSTTGIITFNETYSTPAEVKTAYESNLNTNAYTDAEKTKLSGIEAGAEVNDPTNLGQSRNATSYTITSSTGTNTTLAAATTSVAGVMTASDKTKLNGIEAGAEVNTVDSVDGQTGAVTLNYDNYGGWGLQTDGVSRGTITSGEGVNFEAGTNIQIGYSSTNNTITFSAEAGADTNWYLDGLTFDSGTGVLTASVNGTTNQTVSLDGRYATGDNFNSTGTYANLRAQATTKADVGLSGIPNTNGSTVNYLRGDGSWVTPKIQQESQTVSVTTGQTTINLTTITVSSASLPTITVDGYYGIELIRDFTVTNSTTITLGSPIQANGQLTVTNYVAS